MTLRTGLVEIRNPFSSVSLTHDEIESVDLSRSFAVVFKHHGKATRALGFTATTDWPGAQARLNSFKMDLKSALPDRVFEVGDGAIE